MDRPSASLWDFTRAYATNWFAVMSGGPSVPAAILAVYVQNDMARWLLWGTAALALVLSAYFVWREERLKVMKLDVSARKEEVRHAMARLRGEGVAHRNNAEHCCATEPEWDDWETKADEWRVKVILTIQGISDADAMWWATLDVVPPPRIALDTMWADDVQKHEYAMHDFRLDKLEKLIVRYGEA